MPKPKKVVEAPVEKVEVVDVPEVVVSKPAEQRPTGKFEKLLHDGKYYLVNVDGRILSAGLTEDDVDRMVMNLNNKRR